MANTIFTQNNFMGGIQPYPKLPIIKNGYAFGYCVNYRDDPNAITLQPASVKESGSVVTDLIKWGDMLPTTLDSYFYGNTGNIYHRSSTPTWSNLWMAAQSHGNGLAYFFADDYLYYTTDSTIGRGGPVSTNPSSFSFVDDFLKAQGGVPQNTASLVLASASSQYATAADSASLEVVGDLTLETYFKATSLPTSGNSMTLVGKWDESGATRGYKMGIGTISGYFGDGSGGALTISTNTTDSPTNATCTGTAGTQTLSATNASFAAGQVILIYQAQGTNGGQWERNTIQSYSTGTIITGSSLIGTYTSGAFVQVIPRYTNVTVNASTTWTASTWNGSVGGVLAFLANGTFTNNGTISAKGCGFRGGSAIIGGAGTPGNGGEGQNGGYNANRSANNGVGAGAGDYETNNQRMGGGGGGNGAAGTNGDAVGNGPTSPGIGGAIGGSNDLTTSVLGGGGGSGSGEAGTSGGTAGGNGGGWIFASPVTFTNNSVFDLTGTAGASDSTKGAGGGGAGGSALFNFQTGTIGSVNLSGGSGGTGFSGIGDSNGGAGGGGRIAVHYLTSYTAGTITGAGSAYYIQDSTLVTTTTYQAQMSISDNGTSFETATMNLTNLTTGVWHRLSATYAHSTSLYTFYMDGVSLGTFTGAKTSISSNAALLYVGANKGAAAVGNFFNGKLNDMRIWSNVQTASQIYVNLNQQVATNSVGLQAYYYFNSAYTDATANANTLTAHNTPTFDSSDVPFPAPTTRLDIDQSFTTTGHDYDLLTSISEASTDKLVFAPSLDPQKSVDFNINAPGTGNWTVTVHDQQNNVIATKTILNANLQAAGYQEFIYATPWRVVPGKTYHMHLISTVNDGSVVSSADDDFSTGNFHTYYGFLVTDTAYHPILPFLNFLAIGNERYVATWDGAFYHANAITFPSGWRVRCMSVWREFLAIGVWRGPSITSYTHGRVYFWDGIAPTFNFFIDVPDGQINALWGRDSDLFIVAGYRGDLLDYSGNYFFDTGNSSSNKIRFLPQRSPSGSIEVFPGAMNYYRNLLQVGFAGADNMTGVVEGVYSYGTYDPQMPQTVSLDYLLSTGDTTNISIGCVYPVGSNLIITWQDGIAFGADVINYENNNPAPHGRIELMIQDMDAIWHTKGNYQVRADFEELRVGESIDCAVKLDRDTWITSPVDTTIGDTYTKLYTSAPGRAREIQLAVDMYATGTTSPTLLGVSAQQDDLKEEQTF